MDVFIVMGKLYGDYEIAAVFSDEVKADRYADTLKNDDSWEHVCVDIWSVDTINSEGTRGDEE